MASGRENTGTSMRNKQAFVEWVKSDYLPACRAAEPTLYCGALVEDSINAVSEHDAEWFLRAIEHRIAGREGKFFTAQKMAAREFILYPSGSNTAKNRPIKLSLEPVISIGSMTRLVLEFGWPIESLGMQSPGYAFDVVGYDPREEIKLLCEIKYGNKVQKLTQYLINSTGQDLKLETDKNFYKKLCAVHKFKPKIVWILGEAGNGAVLRAKYKEGCASLIEAELNALYYKY